jgi:Mce-associated membrane protein
MVLSGILAAGGISVSAYVLHDRTRQHQDAMREVDMLDFVRSFMTGFTTVDPFNANDYVKRIMDQATGDFAKEYHDRQNQILIQTAQREPSKGTILTAGVERWSDDRSNATVLVATDTSSKTPDQKQLIDTIDRWVVIAQREGDQWKISQLHTVPVI